MSDHSLGSFIQLYKKHYGVDLTVGEARAFAGKLIALYELILQPLPTETTSRSEGGPARTGREGS